MSTHLLPLFIEMIMRHNKEMAGIKIDGMHITIFSMHVTLCYCQTEQKLEKLMVTVVEESETKGLEINKRKP
jgi:hypothetical protein